jgi:hypothetical protein
LNFPSFHIQVLENLARTCITRGMPGGGVPVERATPGRLNLALRPANHEQKRPALAL